MFVATIVLVWEVSPYIYTSNTKQNTIISYIGPTGSGFMVCCISIYWQHTALAPAWSSFSLSLQQYIQFHKLCVGVVCMGGAPYGAEIWLVECQCMYQ